MWCIQAAQCGFFVGKSLPGKALMMDTYHVSVLLQETIDYLQIQEGQKYIDATLGGGGHTKAILEKGGIVLGIDTDLDAISYVKKILRDKDTRILSEKEEILDKKNEKSLNISVSGYPNNILLVRGNFKDIGKIAEEKGFTDDAGILFDLGVSGHQFDDATRGFSFQQSGPLDMRMSQELSVTAKDLINGLTKNELIELFRKLGEERFAPKIAARIVGQRKEREIATTDELATIVRSAVPYNATDSNPSTRIFQALRIAVNDELNALRVALPQAVALLRPKGRLAVISFHSLEDRIVKNSFLEFEKKGLGSVVTKKPVVPTEEEVLLNRRSRSAKLRVFERN